MPIDASRMIEIAKSSVIASYWWKNCGRAPIGYVRGVTVISWGSMGR